MDAALNHLRTSGEEVKSDDVAASRHWATLISTCLADINSIF
jgi:hypothetical protein